MANEYNQRQYWLMLERLSAYEAGALSLQSLSTDIEGLIHTLEGVSDGLRNSLLTPWGVFDTGVAIMRDEGTRALDSQRAKAVNDAVGTLKLLVLNEIDDPADLKRE